MSPGLVAFARSICFRPRTNRSAAVGLQVDNGERVCCVFASIVFASRGYSCVSLSRTPRIHLHFHALFIWFIRTQLPRAQDETIFVLMAAFREPQCQTTVSQRQSIPRFHCVSRIQQIRGFWCTRRNFLRVPAPAHPKNTPARTHRQVPLTDPHSPTLTYKRCRHRHRAFPARSWSRCSCRRGTPSACGLACSSKCTAAAATTPSGPTPSWC